MQAEMEMEMEAEMEKRARNDRAVLHPGRFGGAQSEWHRLRAAAAAAAAAAATGPAGRARFRVLGTAAHQLWAVKKPADGERRRPAVRV